jgi:hypothetical protein
VIGVKRGAWRFPSEPRGITFNQLHSVLAEVKTERW